MPAQVESQILFEAVDVGKIASLAGFSHLRQGVVRPVNVGLVVLGVVQLHDASADVGLKRRVIVG